jgi:hypothetical protein
MVDTQGAQHTWCHRYARSSISVQAALHESVDPWNLLLSARHIDLTPSVLKLLLGK